MIEPEPNVITAFLESMNATRWGLLGIILVGVELVTGCLLYTSPSPRDATLSRMPSSA